MAEPIFIGVGTLQGYWDANANTIYNADDIDDLVSGAVLESGDWNATMDGNGTGCAGRAPRAGDYLKVKTYAHAGPKQTSLT